MSEPSADGKQGNRGKKKQIFTERALRRAGRACPDRILRLHLDNGVLDLLPVAGEVGREQQENDFDDAPDEKRSA
jgi:hypothetical protein